MSVKIRLTAILYVWIVVPEPLSLSLLAGGGAVTCPLFLYQPE